jgi:hypothetical protein
VGGYRENAENLRIADGPDDRNEVKGEGYKTTKESDVGIACAGTNLIPFAELCYDFEPTSVANSIFPA